MRTVLVLLCLLMAAAVAAAAPHDRSYRDKLEARNKPKQAAKPKPDSKYKPWTEVTKGAELQEGLLDVYTKGEAVYFAVDADQLDKPFIVFMSLSRGIGARYVLGGLPAKDEVVFDFHRVEDHIQIRQLNTRFRADDDAALRNAIDLTFGNSIIATLPIASENTESKQLLVKMNGVFLSDMADLGFRLQLALQKPVRIDKKKGIFRKAKTFPKNVEVDALLTYSPGDRRGLSLPQVPDSRYIELGVRYSIQMLPEKPMKPRRADDRVGYFMTTHKDFSRDTDDSFFVYNITRWRLEKKDPSARISEPKQPIVFYVDTTVPEEYREYIAQGIEMWQKAFEAAGFRNGIIAKDAAGEPGFDAEDSRFHTIRWITTDEPSFLAIGPSRADPRTGEILDSDILMDHSMIPWAHQNYQRYGGPDAFLQLVDPALRFLQDPADNPALADLLTLQQANRFGAPTCDMAHGFAMNFNFLQLAVMMDGMAGDGLNVPKEYVGQTLAFITAHEVGHALGLRHNFKSSIATPFERLNDRAYAEKVGLTGSIMDYPTANVSRDRSKQGYYYSPSIGTYDVWAIEYGYSELDGDLTPEQEARRLDKVASNAYKTENAYGTDEDTYPAGALDPASSIWDLSDAPLAWADERIGVCHDIMSNGALVDRVVGDEGNYVPLRSAVITLFLQEYSATSRALKYVGGQRTARPHRGDSSGQKPLMPVPASEQREAMRFLTENALSPQSFAIRPDILALLQDNKLQSWHNNPYTYGRRFDFPLAAWVGAMQNAIITQLLAPQRLGRMQDAEYTQDDPYRVSEMLAALTQTIWTDNMIASGRSAVMQRNLQRIYLGHLVGITLQPVALMPPESVALARLQLTRIRAQLSDAYATSGLNDEQNAHLSDSMSRIDRALDAKVVADS